MERSLADLEGMLRMRHIVSVRRSIDSCNPVRRPEAFSNIRGVLLEAPRFVIYFE